MSDDTCPVCGKTLQVSDWPYCPHGRGMSASHQDSIPGGMVVENGFEHPIRVYSHSEHRRLLKERGCVIAAKNAGPNDKICRPWTTMDAYTLEAARVLVSRGTTKAPDAPFRPDADVSLTKSSVTL